jgi:RHS repeat-associated protein
MAMFLAVGITPGEPRPGAGFPLSGLTELWSWLRLNVPWAGQGDGSTLGGQPEQRMAGGAGGREHYATSDTTRADGGAGGPAGRGIGALDAEAWPQSSTKPWTAKRLQGVGYVEATSTREATRSSMSSDTFQNADGSVTRRVYDGQKNYRAADGTWRPVDTHLVTDNDGRLHMGANSLAVSVARAAAQPSAPATQAGAAATGTEPLVSMVLESGERMSYELLGAAGVAATWDDSTATYRQILPHTDLQLTTRPAGIKEVLVLASPEAANSWVFPLRLEGLTVRLETSGEVTLRDKAGVVAATIPRGSMRDSNVDPHSGSPATSDNVTYDLIEVDGSPALRVTAGLSWLRDPARVFPVSVDPTTVTRTTGDVWVDNSSSTTNGNDTDLPVGTYNGGTTKVRSFIAMNEFGTDVPPGSRVTSATLNVYHTWSFDCGTHQPVTVSQVTQAWTVAGLTNGSYPGPSLGATVGTLQINNNSPACTNTGSNAAVGAWRSAALATSLFSGWARGAIPNYGLALTASETDSTAWKKFTSADQGDGSLRPYLDITYEWNEEPQVDAQYPESGQAVDTLTPELIVSAHDPDAYPNPVLYLFQVKNKAGVEIANTGWRTSSRWTVPSGTLVWGENYTWTVIVGDGADNSSTQQVHLLRTPPPQQPILSTLSQNGGRGLDASIGNYTITATDATVAGVGPALSVQRYYNSQDPRLMSAFGLGWSSVVDANVVEDWDSAGVVRTVAVTYPSGQVVVFGRNADGSFTPPSGRYATLTRLVNGSYQLVEKDGTIYRFGLGAGNIFEWLITSIADSQGRTLTFDYVNLRLSTITAASGRALHLTWGTTPPSSRVHVLAVATDPAVPGDSASVNTWHYTYVADMLTKVCPPTSSTACTTYNYGTGSLYQTAVANSNPYSYWRLNETSGTVAHSLALENAGADNGSYVNVAPSTDRPVPASASGSSLFDGASSAVYLPADLVSSGSNQSVSLWFKSSGGSGVLYGQSWDPSTTPGTTGAYSPTIYLGTDGKVRGEFPAARVAGALGSLLGAGSGRCLDVTGNTAADGALLQIYDCNGGPNQQFTLTSSGELRVTTGGATKCVDAVGGLTDSGTAIQVWTCNGGTNQKWFIGADGLISGQASGRCLDVWTNATANTSPIKLYDCFDNRPGNQSWFASAQTPMESTGSLADGQWHNVVLTGAGDTQRLFVDGNQVASKSGLLQDLKPKYGYLGVGFLGGGWPAQAHPSSTTNAGVRTYYPGLLSEVAVYDKALTPIAVGDLYAALEPVAPLLSVVRPSGQSAVTVAYDPVTADVSQLTDENGGVWHTSAPVVSGTSQVYATAVLVGGPSDYWRLADNGVVDAINEVHGNTASYSSVTLGNTGGPFADTTVASFDGTSSYLALPSQDVPQTGPNSMSLWFKTPAGSTAGGTLFGYQTTSVTQGPVGNWVPALYVGTDGKLRGYCWCNGANGSTSSTVVNDGNWHHAVLATNTTATSLYLDGALVGTTNLASVATTAAFAHVGAGSAVGWPGASANPRGHFTGSIAEVAYYSTQLPPAQVEAQFGARVKANAAPGKVLTVTDPGNKPISTVYDLRTGRRIAEIDALGKKTQYAYDEKGFLLRLVDPNGNVTVNNHDVRGNLVSSSTCQDFSANKCSTAYYTYYPDATTAVLTPDPRNDKLLTERRAGSASATDNAYLTTYTYDDKGNRTRAVDELGRSTVVSFTDATSVAAVDTGFVPAGLPAVMTQPGGGIQRISYFHSGDVATVTDPAGKVTSYTYDGLGRIATETEVTETYPAGLITSYTYDRLDRPITETSPAVTDRVTGAVHTPVTTTGYSVDGFLTSQTVSDSTGGDASRAVTLGYNVRGQKVSQTDAVGQVTQFGYDAYGRVTTVTNADGNVITTSYDAEGNELEVRLKDWTGTPASPNAPDLVLTSMAYDPAGRLASETDAMGWVTSYTYTDNGLVATVSRRDPSTGAVFVAESNAYDATGNRVSQTTNNGLTTTTSTFDAAARTVSSTLDPVSLNPNGLNRTTTQVYSPDDDVVATNMSDSSGVLGTTETMYDAMGRVRARTSYPKTGLTPVARWPLNETTGTKAADSSGNSPATMSSGATWSTDHGGSVAFDSTSSTALTSAAPAVDTTRSFTVAAWVKVPAVGFNSAIVSQGSLNGSSFVLGAKSRVVQLDRWEMTVCPSAATTATQCVTAELNATAGVWTHLVGVYDQAAGKVRLYVNGGSPGTADIASPAARSNGPVRIGGAATPVGNPRTFNGSVDDVQMYSKALTDAEVGQVYAGTAPAVDASVIRTSATLDRSGTPTSVIDPLGNPTTLVVDEAGQTAVSTSPPVSTVTGTGAPVTVSAVTWAGYNTFGEQVEAKDANGKVTTYRYDAVGRLIETALPSYTAPGSSTPITSKVTNMYDSVGQLEKMIDPLGGETTYTHDQLGRVVKVVAPDGGISQYSYSFEGEQLSQIDPTGAKATSTFDYLGRTVTSTSAVRQTSSNFTTTYTYGVGPWPTSVSTPGGVTTALTYNPGGELLSLRDGANNTTTMNYDGLGRTTRTTRPDGTYTTTTYDRVGRPTATTDYDSTGPRRTQSNTYDAGGHVVGSTDGRGTTKTFSYDASGRLTSQQEPISGSDSMTTTFGYDPAGNQTRMVDGRGNPFITTYNAWGLPESQIEPATTAFPALADRTFTLAYDANGRVARADAPGGVTVNHSYDPMGRLLQQTGAGAEATTVQRSFGYDLAGRMVSLSGSGGTNTLTYDDRSLLLSVAGPSGGSTFTYNADGSMATRQDAAGTTSYGYDTAGRLSTTTNTAASVAMTYSYDNLSQVSSIGYGTGAKRRDLGYDTLHRITSDELKTSTGTSIAKISYEWDLNDNLTKKTTAGLSGAAVNTYGYDLADRLISWDNGTTPTVYAYDKSGNRLQAGTKTYAYDQRNQLSTASDGTVYQYTARGTLRHTIAGASSVDTTVDAFGQVITQQAPGGATSTYTYDGLGRAVQPGFSYSGLGNSLAADTGSSYVRGPEEELVGVVSGGSARLAWTDLHTDVVGQFTATGTTLSGSKAYDPFGTVLTSVGMLGNLGYQSGWTDSVTSRVNMWSRWYNPGTGQFDTRDGATLSATPTSGRANKFGYAEGSPLVNTDPSGQAVASDKGGSTCKLTPEQCELEQINAEIAYQQAMADQARRDSLKSLASMLLSVGLDMLLDAIGFNDARDCFGKGDIWACVSLVSSVIPWSKVFKLGKDLYKMVERGLKAYKAWRKVVDAGKALLRRATGMLEKARKRLEELRRRMAHPPAAPKKKPPTPKTPGKPKSPASSKPPTSKPAAAPKPKTTPKTPEKPKTPDKPKAPDKKPKEEKPKRSEPDDDGPAEQSRRDDPQQREPKTASCQAAGRHSFDPATRVLMADGSSRPIAEVNIGDKVATADPVTGEKSVRAVTMLHLNRDDDLVDVTVSSAPADQAAPPAGEGDGDRSTRGPTSVVLQTTEHHPFWDATAGRWVDAADLTPGVSTLVGPDGQIEYVTAVARRPGAQIMRDLTVATVHTYYVIAGKTSILVHNNDPGFIDLGYAGESCPLPSEQLRDTADTGDRNGADFASEYISPSGRSYTAYNTEYVRYPDGIKDVLRDNKHPAFVCSEIKCLAKAYIAEGPSAISGGTMTTVHVGDTRGPHGTPARPCGACRRTLTSLFVNILGG